MDLSKPLELFSFGIYSLAGAGAVIALYFLFYGARCADSWMKKQPMPTERVWAHVVIAALLGLALGSLIQGVINAQGECAMHGMSFGQCIFVR